MLCRILGIVSKFFDCGNTDLLKMSPLLQKGSKSKCAGMMELPWGLKKSQANSILEVFLSF